MKKIKPNIEDFNNWDDWCFKFETNLKELGYKKYKQNYKNEDFAYWKVFFENDKKKYQVGVFFYDMRKYIDRDSNANRIGIQYECMILGGDRIDLTVSKEKGIDPLEFELMAESFYTAMSKF